MLNTGFIEDENDYYNESFDRIIENCNKLTGNCIEVKKYLINKFKYIGEQSYGGFLFDQYFLLPIKVILENDRWGHDRYGTNSISRPIDFDLSVNIEKYKDIEKFTIAFLLRQHSG
jgi:hypothetical protein